MLHLYCDTLYMYIIDKFGVERYLYQGQCLDACPEAFYHTKEKSCERCSDHCRLCTGPTYCLKCNSSYYISDGGCAKLECGEGKQGHTELLFSFLCDLVTEVSEMTLTPALTALSHTLSFSYS